MSHVVTPTFESGRANKLLHCQFSHLFYNFSKDHVFLTIVVYILNSSTPYLSGSVICIVYINLLFMINDIYIVEPPPPH